MIEHTKRDGRTITLDRAAQAGRSHCSPRQRSAGGQRCWSRRRRAWATPRWRSRRKQAPRASKCLPRRALAILSTGDEVVDARAKPGPLQVRNSNGISIEILARTAGAEPIQLGNAPDEKGALRAAIERGLEAGHPGPLRRRIHGQVRSGRAGARRSRRGISLHRRRDSPRPPRCVCDVPQQTRIWPAGKSGFDHGDVRTFRSAGDRCVQWRGCRGPLPIFRAKLATPVREKGP